MYRTAYLRLSLYIVQWASLFLNVDRSFSSRTGFLSTGMKHEGVEKAPEVEHKHNWSQQQQGGIVSSKQAPISSLIKLITLDPEQDGSDISRWV